MKTFLITTWIAGRQKDEFVVTSTLQMRAVLLIFWAEHFGGTPDLWWACKTISIGSASTNHNEWFDPDHLRLDIEQCHKAETDRWVWEARLEQTLATPRLTQSRAE